jgi:hypothetical protein
MPFLPSICAISILTMAPIVGVLIIATLLVAPVSNLLILPAKVLALARLGKRL